MSFKSDYSEDTDEFMENIRAELGERDVMEEESLPTLQRGVRFGGVPLEHELFPRESAEYSTNYNVGDISKLLYSHSTQDGYLTDDEYEVEQRKVSREVDFDVTPVNSTQHYKPLGSERLESYKQLGIAASSPDLFQTPMHFPKTPANNWDEREIETLKNKIYRQTLSHKSELDEHIKLEKDARLKLTKSHHENQLLMKGMKIQLSNLQQKLREMQSEKVRLASECCKQQAAPKEEVVKFKEIAEHYKCIVKEQDSKVLNLEQLIHDLSADINQLNSRLSERDKEIHDLNEKLKEQAREFAICQSKKQTEAQDNLNKSQKLHHREKVLSVAKIQEDLSQTHNEEVYQLKNSLTEEKNRALSRIEETYAQKFTKSEEMAKKLEKEAKSLMKKIEEKDDVIKNLEIQHKKEIQELNTELHKLQSNLQKASKDTSQSKTQAVAKLRQDSEEHILYRIQLAVESNQKTHQAETHRLKANLKRATDKLNSLREQNAELLKKDKTRTS